LQLVYSIVVGYMLVDLTHGAFSSDTVPHGAGPRVNAALASQSISG